MYKLYFGLSVLFGCTSNALLRETDGYTKVIPTIICLITVLLYQIFLSKAMIHLPISYAYVMYSAITIIILSIIGIVKYKQYLDIYFIIGVICIIIGMILININSKKN